MSDTPAPAPTPQPAPAPTPSPAPQPAPAAPADPFANPLAESEPLVSRGFAENLRAEGLKYRTELRGAQQRLHGYDSVFGVYDDADRQTWLDLASTWASDPTQAAHVMQQIAQAVLGEETPAGGQSAPTSAAPTTPLEGSGLSV